MMMVSDRVREQKVVGPVPTGAKKYTLAYHLLRHLLIMKQNIMKNMKKNPQIHG